jgi:serine/threonine-protein kinase
MGRVFQAFDPHMNRRVALKVASATVKGAFRDERMVRLRREARIAAALDSPFIVAIHDIDEHQGHPFVVMELIQGRPLSHYFRAQNPACRRRVTWLCQLASALGTIHRAGLVHRDIKPDNVIVHQSESFAKILDFGIARRIVGDRPGEQAEETALLTAEGAVMGTPRYMSPEQIQSLPVDSASDQFSWGVVAYELLTGQNAWEGSMMGVLVQILTHAPVPLCELNPEVPEAVDAVVLRALSKLPQDRFVSMDEVSALLVEHADPDLFTSIAKAPPPPTPAIDPADNSISDMASTQMPIPLTQLPTRDD